MRARVTIAISLCAALLLAACKDSYDADVEPGPNGEPGTALRHVYSQEFKVAEAEYFAALNEFYSFARAQVFEHIDFGDCFADMLDFVPNKQGVPCIGMFAAKGAPTKAHMTFTILAKSFNRLDYSDFLTCRIDIYINESYEPVRSIAPAFKTNVAGKLQELDHKVAAGFDSKR